MKALSQYRGNEALDLLADLLEPLATIIADKETVKKFRENRLVGIGYAIKHHKKDVMKIMAKLDDKSVNDFEKDCNLVTLPKMILEVLNDKDLLDFFNSQAPNTSSKDSGAVTENTEEAKPSLTLTDI